MESWIATLLLALALPQYSLVTIFLVSFASATLLPDWQQPRVPIYLLFPERRLMPRKLRVFIDFMMENSAEFGIDKLL